MSAQTCVPWESRGPGHKFTRCSHRRYGLGKAPSTFAVLAAGVLLFRSSHFYDFRRHGGVTAPAAVHESLTTLCKCHGVSGACNIKTCWRGLSSLRHVSQRLRRRYQVAVEVARHAPAGVGGSPHKIVPVSDHVGRLQKADLVYRTKSPDYCSWDTRVGSLGTEGRTCNSTESGTLGCDSMCCGRGYITLRKQVSERCHCRYHWCCFVECKTCSDWTLVDVCK